MTEAKLVDTARASMVLIDKEDNVLGTALQIRKGRWAVHPHFGTGEVAEHIVTSRGEAQKLLRESVLEKDEKLPKRGRGRPRKNPMPQVAA